MELSNEFEVAAPIERTWKVLTDLERIAPCLPGAQLQEAEGEEHRGVIKEKVGPITGRGPRPTGAPPGARAPPPPPSAPCPPPLTEART